MRPEFVQAKNSGRNGLNDLESRGERNYQQRMGSLEANSPVRTLTEVVTGASSMKLSVSKHREVQILLEWRIPCQLPGRAVSKLF